MSVRRRFIVVVAALVAMAPRSADAQGVGPLGLDEVLRSVDRSFPLIAAAAREQDEARGAQLSAEGGFDPSVKGSGVIEPVSGYPKQYFTVQAEQPTAIYGTSFFAGYRYGSGKIPIYDGRLETNDFGEARGGVKVPLLRDGAIDRRRASVRQAELGITLAKLGLDQQRIEARRVAALRFWDWVAAGQRVKAMQAWLDLALARDEALGTRAATGDIPEIDRTENRRTILQRQTSLVGAERDLAQASFELSLFYRAADGSSQLAPSSRLPKAMPEGGTLDLAKSATEEERALARRPDLKRFDLVRDRSRIEADLARNQQLPSIDVTAYGARQFGPGDPARGEPVLGAAVYLDIPILNRVQNGREQAAEAGVAKTEEQKRYARDRVVADVRAAMANIEAARQRSDLAKKEVTIAEQLAVAELRRFELGESTLLLVNLREQATTEATMREIDALADFQRAVATFRAATARDLP